MTTSVGLNNALCTGKRILGACKPSTKVIEMRLNRRDVRGLTVGMDGVQILCAGGALWITQDGDPKDHFLKLGDRFTTTGRGRVVVQGL
jgi:hypothetical protein